MKQFNLCMGPEIAPAQNAEAPRFWNVTSVDDEEGEITLYGDVVSRQPVNWRTGEPDSRLYITPEGFMDDLAAVRDKPRITVKLNSCGGDLYTGIAIHNALKALKGDVNVIVEGIAASAASVIMCAGKTVTVYPGSLVMIHGVSTYVWDAMNIQDMKQMIKAMDASERAVAEIYSAKTGIAEDTLRGMMDRETWMTGREALEKGFADEVRDEETEPEMSMSADREFLIVNGVQHSMKGLRHVPGFIPVMKNSAKPAKKPEANTEPAKPAGKGGNRKMTLDELKAQEPDLVAQIEQSARDAAVSAQAQERADAVSAERKRMEEIDSIAASVPDQQMVHDAKYGENPCTAQELCFRVMKQTAAAGQQFLADYTADGAASGAGQVGAAPNGGAAMSKEEQDAADIAAVMKAYNEGGKQA